MYNLAIRNCTSPSPPKHEVEKLQMKIYDLAGDRTPDTLNQRQTCYHLSQMIIKVCLSETYSRVRVGRFLSDDFPIDRFKSTFRKTKYMITLDDNF